MTHILREKTTGTENDERNKKNARRRSETGSECLLGMSSWSSPQRKISKETHMKVTCEI